MAELLTTDDILNIQEAVAPASSDEEVSLIEVWRVPESSSNAIPVVGGRGKDKYGQPIGLTPLPSQQGQQRQQVAIYPARISRAGIGNEKGFEYQPVTVAPFTVAFNWADSPDIRGGDELIVAKSEFVDGEQVRLVRAANTAYTVGDLVQPATSNRRVYRCKTAGTTGASEPVWPRSAIGATVTDGSVVWEYVSDLRCFEVIDPGGETTYNITRLVRCEEVKA